MSILWEEWPPSPGGVKVSKFWIIAAIMGDYAPLLASHVHVCVLVNNVVVFVCIILFFFSKILKVQYYARTVTIKH